MSMQAEAHEAAEQVTKGDGLPDDARTQLEQLGYEYVDPPLATSRFVFETQDDTVIKIPQKPHHVKTNRKEVENWEAYGDSGLLAPIVDYDPNYVWIEMVYCEPVGQDGANDFLDKVMDSGYQISDIHGGNVGRHPDTGELVSIDYPEVSPWE